MLEEDCAICKGLAGDCSSQADWVMSRVIIKLEDSGKLNPGDILVTATTAPPWTPLFAVASAIVVETGGMLSHAAVTAREYGIPAVLAVQGATRTLRDGQLLEVNGSDGIVRLVS